MKKFVLALAVGFGLGFSPIASGTFGALLGLPIVYFLFPHLGGIVGQIIAAILLTLLAIPICDVAEKHYRKKDDGRIVADEYLTFPICMIGLPYAAPAMLLTAFLTNRFFDILKPPPARLIDTIMPGGAGITLDDAVAALYALGANWLLYLYLLKPMGWA
ncbi:MAG TPA: phosphatidylglycerophosphatase A [Kiritimatiellia bacterium]|nr:phosphatidylglycerophosphatase A [Kiritimatiellia bacterium]